jgi:hypothetical protein
LREAQKSLHRLKAYRQLPILRNALHELMWQGLLKTGGCFRLIVPDLNYFALQYIDNPNIDGAHKFMKDSGLGIERPAVSMFEKLRRAIGFSRHLWMYDEKTLTFELERVGFMKIRRCVFGDAQIPEFSEVEDRGRFENCLAIECFK